MYQIRLSSQCSRYRNRIKIRSTSNYKIAITITISKRVKNEWKWKVTVIILFYAMLFSGLYSIVSYLKCFQYFDIIISIIHSWIIPKNSSSESPSALPSMLSTSTSALMLGYSSATNHRTSAPHNPNKTAQHYILNRHKRSIRSIIPLPTVE